MDDEDGDSHVVDGGDDPTTYQARLSPTTTDFFQRIM